MATEILKFQEEQIKAQKEIIVAEIKNGWLSRNWRPILMLTIVAIVANNYIVYPYLSMFTDNVKILSLPDKLWNLMQIGVGGYIVGRSGEKIIETWKKG
jgi:predicted MFS family arabinose efflux permease